MLHPVRQESRSFGMIVPMTATVTVLVVVIGRMIVAVAVLVIVLFHGFSPGSGFEDHQPHAGRTEQSGEGASRVGVAPTVVSDVTIIIPGPVPTGGIFPRLHFCTRLVNTDGSPCVGDGACRNAIANREAARLVRVNSFMR
jgi:hypothetical protein